MATTPFDGKAFLIGLAWMHWKDDDEMSEFFAYNDIGVPLAFCFSEKIITLNPTVEQYINETWDLLLQELNIEDTGFDSLRDIEIAMEEQPGLS
jgi:hypothetical protein